MSNKIKVIYKRVGEVIPKILEIDDNLNTLQKYVGGYIETLYIDNNVVILVDEEGKLKNKQPNFVLQIPERNFLDVIVGDVLILGVNEPEFRSLTDEECEKYLKIFSKRNIVL